MTNRLPLKTSIKWLAIYFWNGFAGLAGLCCFLALWQYAHELYGSFIVPSPFETYQAMVVLAHSNLFMQAALETAKNAVIGFFIALSLATILGVLCGYSFTAIRLMRPIVTIILAVPAVGWIILAIIWFDNGSATVVLTISVALFPLIFATALQASATRVRPLEEMARIFALPAYRRFCGVDLPHLLSYLLPAYSISAGSAWKIAVMAELISYSGGIGNLLLEARATFNVAEVSALLSFVVLFALLSEYAIIYPLKELVEGWRHADEPWGIKR